MPFAPSSFLLLVAMPGAPSSVFFCSSESSLLTHQVFTRSVGRHYSLRPSVGARLGVLDAIDPAKGDLGNVLLRCARVE